MVDTGLLDWAGVAERMSASPARIGRVPVRGGSLQVGAAADVVLVDPAARRVVDPAAMATAGRNTPFRGRVLPGRVVATFLRGHATVLDGVLAEPAPDLEKVTS
jgi:dihydroorotase